MKKSYLLIAVFIFSWFTPADAGDMEKQEARQAAIDLATSAAKNEMAEVSQHFPDWLKRTDVVLDVQENHKPIWSVETIQPLFETDLDTIFIQGRAASSNNDGTFNLGAGYRRLLDDKSWMFGLNGFYDRTTKRKHQRLGAGMEIFSQYGTLRGNYYNTITSLRSYTDNTGSTVQEWSLDGADINLETPLPYFPWVQVTGKAFQWKTINLANNIRGWTAGIRANPMDFVEIEAGFTDDNLRKSEAYAQLTWHFGKPNHVEHTMFDGPVSKQFMNA